MSADPAVVDVTDGPAVSEVVFRITDDVTGVSSGSVLVTLDDLSWKHFFDTNNLIEGTPNSGTYRAPVQFISGSPPGERPIGVVAFDNSGRSSFVDSDDVTITIINNGPVDREPPTIHSLTLTPQVLDLTNGSGEVILEMDVSDDVTGIYWIFGDLEPPIDDFSPDTRKFAWSLPTTGSERKILKATYPLGQWTPAGEWRLEFEEFVDGVRRGSKYGFGAPELYEDFEATVTVINPNEDLVPPTFDSLSFERTTVDTTFGKVLVPYSISFQDAASGLDSASVRLHPPSGGRYIWAYRKGEQGIEEGTLNNGTISGYFEIPPFIENGSWSVSVRLTDRAGHSITFGHGSNNPLPPGVPTSIMIQNEAGADQELMQATAVSFNPDPVDITEVSQFVDVTVSYTDNLSGLDFISVRVESPDGAFRESVFLDFEDIVSGTTTDGTVKGQIRIPKFSPPGTWTIESFAMNDIAGNYDSLIGSPVFFDDKANGFDVINNGTVDQEAPEFISLTLPLNTVDVTNGDVRIPIQASASDDTSGIDSTIIDYKHAESGDEITFFLDDGDAISSDGNVLTMKTDGLIRQFAIPGEYILDEISVRDFVERRTRLRATREPFLPDGLPNKITVINNGSVDREEPQFSDIRLSANSIDITNGPQFITAEIDFTDDQTGLEDIYVRIYHEEESVFPTVFDSWLDDDEYEIIAGNPQSGTARFLIRIPQYLPEGRYEVRYELTDGFRRDRAIRGEVEDTSDFPFPGSGVITLTNSGAADRKDPIITNISILDTPDVTDLDQDIFVSISILDDVSGISELAVSLYGPNDDLVREERFREDLTSGTPTDGTFTFPMTIPAFSDNGEWTIRCFIEDGVNNLELLNPEELEALGLQHTFQVVNRQPAGYLWKESDAYPDDWREVEWLGWVQDQGTYPYVYHLEHGWIYTSGSDLDQFFFYDVNLNIWWWVNEDLYPYIYASGRKSGWFYYYAPFGSPGNRWFFDLTRGVDVPEGDM